MRANELLISPPATPWKDKDGNLHLQITRKEYARLMRLGQQQHAQGADSATE